MTSSKNVIEKSRKELAKNINQGDCVYLKNQEELFQVLGIDNAYKNLIYPKKDILRKFQNLKFIRVDKKRFPIVTLLKKFSNNNSAPIILNASNETLVSKFIEGKISFKSILFYLRSVLGHKHFKKYAIKRSPNLNEIYEIDNWARTKTLELIRQKFT